MGIKRSTRAEAGLLAKQQGKSFEQEFESYWADPGMLGSKCTRIPDGCRQLGPKKLIRVKSPWDFVVTYRGVTALIDTKSTSHDTFPHSNIDRHQVEEMIGHTDAGGHAGYVILFQQTQRVIWVPAPELWSRLGYRGSIGQEDQTIKQLGFLGSMSLGFEWIFEEKL